MKIASDITELVGKTPLVSLRKIARECPANVLGKLEMFNPGGSVKDRIGLNMIEGAIREGKIQKETVIIEPTSGNTGIALAWICAVKEIRLILTMPDSMTRERVSLLKAYGANVILTPAHLGMMGAIEKARELQKEIPNSFILQQFENPHNVEAHKKTTASEIWNDTDGSVDIFVAGVGTGGTVSGVGEVLKQKNPHIKVIAVEPEDSAVLSGKPAGPHMIQGIGAGFIPPVFNRKVVDEIFTVCNDDAIKTMVDLAKYEGILCGISSGANVFAAKSVAARPENKGKNIVTMICDTGERYLSLQFFKE